MKKLTMLILAAVILLAGCGETAYDPETNTDNTADAQTNNTTEVLPETEPEALPVCIRNHSPFSADGHSDTVAGVVSEPLTDEEEAEKAKDKETFRTLYEQSYGIKLNEKEVYDHTAAGVLRNTDYRLYSVNSISDKYYLMTGGEIYRVKMGDFGFGSVTSHAIADPDGDGVYEFYYIYSTGSGISVIAPASFDPVEKKFGGISCDGDSFKTFWGGGSFVYTQDGKLGYEYNVYDTETKTSDVKVAEIRGTYITAEETGTETE